MRSRLRLSALFQLAAMNVSPATPRATDRSFIVHRESSPDGDVATFRLTGMLNESIGSELVAAIEVAACDGVDRVDLDLLELGGFTSAGAQALVAARRVCTSVPYGLHYRTGRGAGRQALLAAYERTG